MPSGKIISKTAGLLAVAALAGCASFQIASNPNIDINSVKKVAVIPFAGTPSQARVAGEWETLLLSLGYKVIERGNISLILKEQGFSASGLVNPSEAPKIGGILGVEGFIMGTPNSRKPYHSYDMTGKPKISEPPPTSVKLIEAETARVIWNITGKEETGETVSLSRRGNAVGDGVKSMLRRTLKSAKWNSFPAERFQGNNIGAVHAAFNSHMSRRRGIRIGMYPFQAGTKELGKEWADKIGGALLKSGYDVIERAQVENVLEEQKISMSGAIRPEDMARLGKIAGLQGLVMGSVYGDPACAYSVKLADSQTGELYWSAYGEDCSASGLSESVSALLE
ncbi:MAG: hypothetical protein HY796_07885 [Elusimicrobia bacterium]|nr:hypothetical protein [Elusimicrobiota bacterium]